MALCALSPSPHQRGGRVSDFTPPLCSVARCLPPLGAAPAPTGPRLTRAAITVTPPRASSTSRRRKSRSRTRHSTNTATLPRAGARHRHRRSRPLCHHRPALGRTAASVAPRAAVRRCPQPRALRALANYWQSAWHIGSLPASALVLVVVPITMVLCRYYILYMSAKSSREIRGLVLRASWPSTTDIGS